MEWWQLGPLVLAVVVFLLAGTVIEQHLETAVLHIINRPQIQVSEGVETSPQQELQQQHLEWREREKLQKKHEELRRQQEKWFEKQQLLQQMQRLHKEQLAQQQQCEAPQQQQELRKKEEVQKILQQKHSEPLLRKQHENKGVNISVNHQLTSSQTAFRPVLTSPHCQQEQLSLQLITQQSKTRQQSTQQLQTVQQKRQPSQLSDMEPPLPFLAASEKSILSPTSKSTVVSKALDIQTKPNT